MVIHLRKEHDLSLKGREMHEFVVFDLIKKKLNTVKAVLDLAKGSEVFFEVCSNIPPFNLPYLYILNGVNIMI